jgi:hypothetical protein
MSITSKIKSKDMEMTLSVSHHTTISSEKSSIKSIISNIQPLVITDPIAPTCISKAFTSNLTMSSAVKAGLVFVGTVGAYYLAKTTGILSYFGWGMKNSYSTDVVNNEIEKIKSIANSLTERTNLEIAKQANNPLVSQTATAYKDGMAVEFEEIRVEEFKNLPKGKKENVLEQKFFNRRSIKSKKKILPKYAYINKLFNHTIKSSDFFSSNNSKSPIKITNIFPSATWLHSALKPTFCNSWPEVAQKALGVAVFGKSVYVGASDGLHIVDIDLSQNTLIHKNSYNSPSGGSIKNVVISENYAYILIDGKGLEIVDISDPQYLSSGPESSYYELYAPKKVVVFDNCAYVVDKNKLQIIDIINVTHPTLKSSYDVPGIQDVTISGNYVYIANWDSGLQIMDITNLTNPKLGLYGNARGDTVALLGNYAYVGTGDSNNGKAGDSGLHIIDISDSSKPTLKKFYRDFDRIDKIVILGNYTLVNDGDKLHIIDITNMTSPVVKGSYAAAGIKDVIVSENYAYIANWNSGLQVIALNLDELTLLGEPTKKDLGRKYTVNVEACNKEGQCETNSFEIIVDLPKVPINWEALVGGILGGVITLIAATIVSLTGAAICFKRVNAKRNRERLKKYFTDVELEIRDEEYKYKKREIAINESAEAIKKAVNLSDRDAIVINSAKLMEEAKSIGKELINPGITATHLADVVKGDKFMYLDRDSKIEILRVFEVYTSLALVVSTVRRQTIYERVQAALIKQIEEVKSITLKNDYEMLFEISCMKEALLIIKSNENYKDVFELFKSATKLKKVGQIEKTGELFADLGELFAAFVKQYRKVSKQWYSKLVSMRYISYSAQNEKEELDNLQGLIPKQGSWQLIYGIVEMLGRIALEGATPEIRAQAYFGKDEKMGLKDYVGYTKRKKKEEGKMKLKDYAGFLEGKAGERAIRGAVLKVLYGLSKQDSSVSIENQESQIIAATELLAERQMVEEDEEVKKVFEQLEKDWAKEERKRSLIMEGSKEEETVPQSQKPMPVKTSPIATLSAKNVISME